MYEAPGRLRTGRRSVLGEIRAAGNSPLQDHKTGQLVLLPNPDNSCAYDTCHGRAMATRSHGASVGIGCR
jgi:hypothetical protein